MKTCVLWTFVVAAGLIVPLQAHHSFAAEYDDKQPVVLKGTVAKFEMIMPHSFLYLDVTDDKGTSRWMVEFANPNSLFRNGWTKNTLKPGMQITLRGFRAKDGSTKAQGNSVQLADGTMLMNRGGANEGAPR